MSTIITLQGTDLLSNSRNDINTNFANLNADKVEGPSSSIDSEIALFSGTGGKTIKRASSTGIAVVTSGVLSVVTAPAGTVVGTSDNQTLTNKRITKRVITTTQSATPTINTDNTDVAYITGLAQAVTSFTTNLSGTPVNGDTLIIDMTDNGTGRAITWGASFEASTVALPTTTVLSTKLTVGFRWNVATSKWTCVAVA